MTSSTPRLRYDLSDEMIVLLDELNKYGYIEQLEHDSLLYSMSDAFVEHLQDFKPKECFQEEQSTKEYV